MRGPMPFRRCQSMELGPGTSKKLGDCMMIKFDSGIFPEGSIGVVKHGLLRVMADGGEVASYESIKNLEELDSKAKREWGRKAMVGVATGLVFAPAFLVGGLLAGNNKEIVFHVELPDGKEAIGIADKKGFAALESLTATATATSPAATSGVPFMQKIEADKAASLARKREKAKQKANRPPAGIIPGVNG